MLINQQTQKEITVLRRAIHADYHGEIELLLYNGSKKDYYVWSRVDPLGHLLVLPCPVTKVYRKPQQSNPGRMQKSTDPSGMKAWATSPGK